MGSVLGASANKAIERDCVGKMKQFASWFTHGVRGCAGLRRAIFEAKTGAAVLGRVEEFFAGEGAGALAAETPEAGTAAESLACCD